MRLGDKLSFKNVLRFDAEMSAKCDKDKNSLCSIRPFISKKMYLDQKKNYIRERQSLHGERKKNEAKLMGKVGLS